MRALVTRVTISYSTSLPSKKRKEEKRFADVHFDSFFEESARETAHVLPLRTVLYDTVVCSIICNLKISRRLSEQNNSLCVRGLSFFNTLKDVIT